MLRFDLHSHTLASGHAFNTVFELASEAAHKNIEAIAITDHGPSMQGAPHLGYFESLEWVPRQLRGVRIIRGCEANIVNCKGDIDIPTDIQKNLDLLVVGLHQRTPYPKNTTSIDNTTAIIKAIQKNRAHIIAHPYRPEFPIDIQKVYNAAVNCGTLLELNLLLLSRLDKSSRALKQIRLMLKIIASSRGKIAVSSDAHIATMLGDDSILRHTDLVPSPHLVLGNENGYQEIEKFLQSK